MATEHLLKMGHRQIAFIGGSLSSGDRAAYWWLHQPLLEFGMTPSGVDRGSGSQIDGARGEALLPAIRNHGRVCYQDIVALGVMQALRKLGVSRAVILRWSDLDITEAALVQPALTTVSVAAKEIGRKAGEL
jgi:LacI family transcriptional regulator